MLVFGFCFLFQSLLSENWSLSLSLRFFLQYHLPFSDRKYGNGRCSKGLLPDSMLKSMDLTPKPQTLKPLSHFSVLFFTRHCLPLLYCHVAVCLPIFTETHSKITLFSNNTTLFLHVLIHPKTFPLPAIILLSSVFIPRVLYHFLFQGVYSSVTTAIWKKTNTMK